MYAVIFNADSGDDIKLIGLESDFGVAIKIAKKRLTTCVKEIYEDMSRDFNDGELPEPEIRERLYADASEYVIEEPNMGFQVIVNVSEA